MRCLTMSYKEFGISAVLEIGFSSSSEIPDVDSQWVAIWFLSFGGAVKFVILKIKWDGYNLW